MTEEDRYLVEPRLQAKSSGVKVPEVQRIGKSLVLHIKLERHQSVKTAYGQRTSYP